MAIELDLSVVPDSPLLGEGSSRCDDERSEEGRGKLV